MRNSSPLSDPETTKQVLQSADVSMQSLQFVVANHRSRRLLGFNPEGEAYRAVSGHLCFAYLIGDFGIALTNDQTGTVVEVIDFDDSRWVRFDTSLPSGRSSWFWPACQKNI